MWCILADSGFMEKIIHLLDVLFAAGWLMNLKMALMEHSDVTDPVCEFLRGANAYIQQRANICCLPDCECLCKSVTTAADVHGWGAQRHMRTGILTSRKNVRVPCLPFSDVGRIHGLIKKKTWPLNSREMCHVGAVNSSVQRQRWLLWYISFLAVDKATKCRSVAVRMFLFSFFHHTFDSPIWSLIPAGSSGCLRVRGLGGGN